MKKIVSNPRKIIELLFKNYFEKHKGYIELRFIEKKSSKAFSIFYSYDEFDYKVEKEIQKLNINHNVYFGVNPRPSSKEKKQEDIKHIVCLWADIDGKDFENGKKEAKEIIDKFLIQPNIIVDSGNGYHCYWILKEPVIIVDEKKKLNSSNIFLALLRN